jgi:hypothetical protein
LFRLVHQESLAVRTDGKHGIRSAGQLSLIPLSGRSSDQPEAHAMSRTAVEPFTLV